MKQTAVSWLVEQLFKQGYFDGNKPLSITNLDHLEHKAKEMEYKQLMDSMQKGMELQEKENYRVGFRERNNLLSSQTEISDEEIEEMLFHHSNEYAYGFKDAIKWYNEQLKK